MRTRAKWPLAIKLTLVMTVMIVIAVGNITLISIRREQATFRSDLEQQADLLLDSLTASGADVLYRLQLGGLQNLLEGLGRTKAIVGGWVYDAEGHRLADAFSLDSPSLGTTDALGDQILKSPTSVFDWREDELVAGKAVVLGHQTIGAFVISLSTAPLDMKMAALRNEGFAVALVAGLLGIIISILLSRTLTEPLRTLIVATDRIAQGDLTQTITVHSSDEVAVLASAFNLMIKQLRETIQGMQQRTDELRRSEEELRVANALARESVRLKSEFMSTMSHELRTPLNAILGFSSILLTGMGGEIDADALHMIERINSNSDRLLHLINNILDIAKIEAGRLEIQSQPLNPRQMAEKWQMQMSVLAENKGLDFNLNIDPSLPQELYGDAERLSQIGINLLSNAFKFTPKGKVTLSLRSDTASWFIEVADTGIGIPPHALNYIFDEFRQVDGSSTRVYGGSGLGLAIVRNLCRMMDGNIKVTSELDKGSTFTVTLPLKLVEERVTA